MPPVIETHELSKTYGRFSALNGLSISLPDGGVFALIGASGSGKTTAIKLLLNLTSPTRGSATLLGVDSRAIGPAVLARVGYVSENQALPPRLRVDEFFTYLRACYVRWDRGLEDTLRGQLRLPPERRICELSHGMRLKMALACALPFHPEVLVLDEPFGGLDAVAREEIIDAFLKPTRDLTILISSHELEEIERLATHVAFLHEGRVLFHGSLAALREYARPLLLAAGHDDAASSSLRAIFIAMVRGATQDRV
jgi:ABC-2 type transport system ATP-binding protein